eukprot:scaffold777_cov159-Amphora_coffeaeformis.AAC.2
MASATAVPRKRGSLFSKFFIIFLSLVLLIACLQLGKDSHLQASVLEYVKGDVNEGGQLSSSSSSRTHPAVSVSNDDGLEPKIAYVSYSYLTSLNDASATRFINFIFGTLQTWLKDEQSLLFVVLTHESKAFYDKLCQDPLYENLCQRVVPISVNCPEGYYGDSPCCKMQEGLLQVFERFPDYDWYMYGDDDNYVRTAHWRDFLRPLTGDDVGPLIVSSGPLKRLGQSSFLHEQQDTQKCSTDHQYYYPWGQPIVYSKSALKRVIPGFKMNGFRLQCKEFKITHDVGNQIFHWMYQMPVITFDIPLFPGHGKAMAIHAHGKIQVNPFPVLKKNFMNVTYPPPPYTYMWHNTTAFTETSTYQKYGPVDTWTNEWHTMPTADCRGPDHEIEYSKEEQIAKLAQSSYDVCIVGAGLSGSVLAERYARVMRKSVLMMDKRHHVGGNCYDYIDKDTGLRVNKYGAHLFHTKHKKVWDYAQMFSKWTPYEHKVIGLVEGKHVPIPVNIETVNILFGLNISTEAEMDAWLENERVHYDHEPRNSEEMALSRVGPRLYELLFKPYTTKQWAKSPAELGPEVTARIPVRNNHDGRYFADPYEALPSHGYTAFFRNIISRAFSGIETHVNMDYFAVRDAIKCGRTYYTGPIDTYFAHLGMDKLEYRSLDFERRVIETHDTFQPAFVVNHPSLDENFTRIVEYKHLPGQEKSDSTVIFIERSKSGGEPYYPVPNERNKKLYAKYQAMADKEDVRFVGRLANYKYFNMDEAILNALTIFEKDRKIPFRKVDPTPNPNPGSLRCKTKVAGALTGTIDLGVVSRNSSNTSRDGRR